jgi:hypothetical protein
MSAYTLTEGLYLYPTPAGAYYAVCSNDADKPKQFLRQLLLQPVTPALNLENLSHLTGVADPEKCLELLYHCQKLNWVQGLTAPEEFPADLLENILPGLLSKMSESGKVLLADMQGFYLASHGFPHEVAEELSGLGVASQAWGILDVFGNSQIGFWPLFVGKNRFVIVISGVPHFNQPEFVKLIWALSKRYASAAG